MAGKDRIMENKLQNWFYNKGGYFWFGKWSHRQAERKGVYVWKGVRWKWLTKLLRLVTGRKFSYYKNLKEFGIKTNYVCIKCGQSVDIIKEEKHNLPMAECENCREMTLRQVT